MEGLKLKPMSDQMKEAIWDAVCDLLAKVKDLNDRAVLVQSAIAEFGPVVNSRGEKVRAFLKP